MSERVRECVSEERMGLDVEEEREMGSREKGR